jgi:nicotinate dehydrogenase subunit A
LHALEQRCLVGEGGHVIASNSPAWVGRPTTDPESFTLEVNGSTRDVVCRRNTPLLYVLRNDLDLKGTRFGCGLGQCGACFVLLDGHPTPSCDLPVWASVGHSIVTVEGLSDDGEPSLLQQCFIEEQAAQCGYCMSGILISATALLESNPAPDEAAVRGALDRNLCRCGSHNRVIRAVLKAVAATDATDTPDVAKAAAL